MSTAKRSSFERSALACGLLTQAAIDEARAALRWSTRDRPTPDAPLDDRQLADKLVELGKLNPWQAEQLLLGRTKFNLGPYRIVDSIGQGGMGQVFKAEHDVMGRVVAIKVLPRSRSTPEAIASFAREIRVLARLDHPNLVRGLDAGHDGNVYYLVTEYVGGTDLRKLVRKNGPLDMRAAATVISEVALGLQHAHEKGLVHRDVKPGNVLVTPDGHAKLLDLGLSGPMEADAETDSRYGKIVGTADYLSPDHIESPCDPKAAWDIYSLGCTLYYAVTGKVPFPGGTIKDKARAHCTLRPLDPRRLNPKLSADFVDVIAEMMAKDPTERTASAEQVAVRLEPWTGAAPMATPPAQTPRHPHATKPEIARAKAADASVRAAEAGDTKSSFPEMPELLPDAKESSSQVSQTTHRGSATAEETVTTVDVHGIEPTPAGTILDPLMLLVVLPCGLVILVVLVYWLMAFFFRG